MDSSQLHSNNSSMQNQQVTFNFKPHFNNQRTYGPVGPRPFQEKDTNQALSHPNSLEMQNQQMHQKFAQISQSKPFESDHFQRSYDENFQKIHFGHKKVRFDNQLPSSNQSSTQENRAQKSQLNFKNALKYQPQSNHSLNFSVAETQNDSMEVQRSNSPSSGKGGLRPRLEQIFENSKRGLPGHEPGRQQQIQQHIKKPYTQMRLPQNSMNNQSVRPLNNEQNNQNQYYNQNRMGAAMLRPYSRIARQGNDQPVPNAFQQQPSAMAMNDFDTRSPPSKRTFPMAQRPKMQNEKIINQSPLIADYRTQHISYEGLQTPLNLISPPKATNADPRAVDQIYSLDGRSIAQKRLFQNDCNLDDEMEGDQPVSIDKGINCGADRDESGAGPTGATSNLPEVQNSNRSILQSIYKDEEDQSRGIHDMKRRLFNDEFDVNQSNASQVSPERARNIENSGVVDAINAAGVVRNSQDHGNAERLWSSITNLQLQAPSILKSNDNYNNGFGFSQLNLNQINEQKENGSNTFGASQKEENLMMAIKDENQNCHLPNETQIKDDSLKFNVCEAKQQMVRPYYVKGQPLFNDLPSIQQFNQGPTRSRFSTHPQMFTSQSSQRFIDTDLGTQNDNFEQAQYRSELQDNKQMAPQQQQVQQPFKRASKKRPLEVLYEQ